MNTNFDYISCGYGGVKLDIDVEIALNRHSYLVEVAGTNGENSTIEARLLAKFGEKHAKYINSRLAKIRQEASK